MPGDFMPRQPPTHIMDGLEMRSLRELGFRAQTPLPALEEGADAWRGISFPVNALKSCVQRVRSVMLFLILNIADDDIPTALAEGVD